MANYNEIVEILTPFGIPGLMALILGWIGKRYLDKKLESEKSENQANIKSMESKLSQYLEVHKQKIKNSEFFFQRQYEASQDLYKIKIDMMPPYRYPDMGWYEALDEMANGLGKTYKSLQDFLNTYFTILNPDVLEKLESAASTAEEGMLYGSDPQGHQCAEHVYNHIKECSSILKSEVDGQRLVEFSELTQKKS
ncbi:MAG: hypothetical protein O7D86_12520 [Proteobacteria bacterium]|nr:hypothetical protein [Pseudomonadota bacterium]